MGRRDEVNGAALRWMTILWLIAIVVLSAIASARPHVLLQYTPYLPGRDKTGHFLLMGGFAGVAVLGFAGQRIGPRRLSPLMVIAAVTVLVLIEEGVQYWLPRRTFSTVDLAWSLAGVGCFGAVAGLWRSRHG
jgi:hypothetical protein